MCVRRRARRWRRGRGGASGVERRARSARTKLTGGRSTRRGTRAAAARSRARGARVAHALGGHRRSAACSDCARRRHRGGARATRRDAASPPSFLAHTRAIPRFSGSLSLVTGARLTLPLLSPRVSRLCPTGMCGWTRGSSPAARPRVRSADFLRRRRPPPHDTSTTTTNLAAVIPGKSSVTLGDLSEWNYDGSSTGQAPGEDSEVIIKPQALFNDPFRGAPHVIVLCDCYTPKGEPIPTNTRNPANAIFEKAPAEEPWFGIEQEYVMFKEGAPLGVAQVGGALHAPRPRGSSGTRGPEAADPPLRGRGRRLRPRDRRGAHDEVPRCRDIEVMPLATVPEYDGNWWRRDSVQATRTLPSPHPPHIREDGATLADVLCAMTIDGAIDISWVLIGPGGVPRSHCGRSPGADRSPTRNLRLQLAHGASGTRGSPNRRFRHPDLIGMPKRRRSSDGPETDLMSLSCRSILPRRPIMGWLFRDGCTRRELIEERTKAGNAPPKTGCSSSPPALPTAFVAAWLGRLVERLGTDFHQGRATVQPTERWIGCDLLRYQRDYGWGYKDMEESMHPYYYSCPCPTWRWFPSTSTAAMPSGGRALRPTTNGGGQSG